MANLKRMKEVIIFAKIKSIIANLFESTNEEHLRILSRFFIKHVEYKILNNKLEIVLYKRFYIEANEGQLILRDKQTCQGYTLRTK